MKEATPTSTAPTLVTPEFLALNGIMFLTFCNVAVFFQFNDYLKTLPALQDHVGLIISIFSLVVLAVRPVISPLLNPLNARKWMIISSAFTIFSLFLYPPAESFWSMLLVRVFHGAAYVVLASAVLSKMIDCIPENRSGQAFGIISIITVLPYAVVPPVLRPLNEFLGGFNGTLDASALLMLLIFPLIALVRKSTVVGMREQYSIGLKDLKENLSDRNVMILLALSLIVWTAFSPVFFFINDYGAKIGIANPGWFLTISTIMEIAVRALAGRIFDRMNKSWALAASLVWLVIGYSALAGTTQQWTFFAAGAFLGLGWGVSMPLLSSLMFDISPARFRALNSNLATQMFQSGFFFGPLLGGALLFQWGHAALYYGCGLLTAVGALTAIFLSRSKDIPLHRDRPAGNAD